MRTVFSIWYSVSSIQGHSKHVWEDPRARGGVVQEEEADELFRHFFQTPTGHRLLKEERSEGFHLARGDFFFATFFCAADKRK
jgi:hypothetical protein